MTPEKLAKLSVKKTYRHYLREQGLWREWASVICSEWNTRFLKIFRYFLPICIIGFVMMTSVVAGDGTNDVYLMKELITKVQAELPQALAAYHEIEKLAGGIQKASTKNRLEDDTAFLYAFLFILEGQKWRIDPTLLAAIAHEESEFNSKAVSHERAKGLMQVHQPTWKISDKDLFNPKRNVEIASRILYILRNSNPNTFLQKYVGAKENMEEGKRYEKAVKSKQITISKFSKRG